MVNYGSTELATSAIDGQCHTHTAAARMNQIESMICIHSTRQLFFNALGNLAELS